MPSRNLFKCPTILKTKREIETLLAGWGNHKRDSSGADLSGNVSVFRERLESFIYDGIFNAAWKWKG